MVVGMSTVFTLIRKELELSLREANIYLYESAPDLLFLFSLFLFAYMFHENFHIKVKITQTRIFTRLCNPTIDNTFWSQLR